MVPSSWVDFARTFHLLAIGKVGSFIHLWTQTPPVAASHVLSAHYSGNKLCSTNDCPPCPRNVNLKPLLPLILRRIWLEVVFPFNLWLCLLKLPFIFCSKNSQSIFFPVSRNRSLGNNLPYCWRSCAQLLSTFNSSDLLRFVLVLC